MGRAVLGLDRIAALIVGFVLLVVGLAAAAWGADLLTRVWPSAPEQLALRTISNAFSMTWWSWAAGIAGAICILLALWWLLAHLPRRGVGTLSLPGSGKNGRLSVDPAGAASTATDVLAEAPGVRSASSRVLRDRGELVVDVKATIEPSADLRSVVEATDEVTADLAQVLGRDDARARIQLGVARRGRQQSRVR
ncbi:alkaline shock response membrane anchor protein AmaP [Kineococcus rubinsiae]|uniref:alkaline shock response membrane anchor protein AmaP n=1 Tax=Kineococcus rubinsiae TaxID=2609562 RepID=UPI001430BCE5|nr:alkaline shock response membrane anchor protein AmaP [Kineococcus rubinsiae]NIZ90376.1 alkaline shock response membrane anchor protein AmaP [Kineococcus rubinsiae]